MSLLLFNQGPTAPTWVSPSDGSSIQPNTALVWKSLASASNAHFQIELDTTDTFDSPSLVRRRSFLDSGFEYWDGSAWTSIGSSGMPSAATGANVRYTPIGQTPGTWFRRVRQSE